MEWIGQTGLIDYEMAVSTMESRVEAIKAGMADEAVWLLEHPPLYTAGTSAKPQDLINPRFPVYQSGRGGQYTYHGPGQRVAYIMLDLKKRQSEPDIKKYVWQLEEWIIKTLQDFSVVGERRAGRVGIWVNENGLEKKIAAVGVRVRHWVTYHGISINVSPDLSHFNGIIPCGIQEFGVAKLDSFAKNASLEALDSSLKTNFGRVF
jgi:lipoyl(octanoyl) transferase